ncbi:sensor histidine kinase [Tenacibaculum sp. 190524A02b]|uniref:sensor histidine kinase n=1 Tax=Tenacibaculum vairaonense TaxID=3137860 RepID=UPI0032B1CC4F
MKKNRIKQLLKIISISAFCVIAVFILDYKYINNQEIYESFFSSGRIIDFISFIIPITLSKYFLEQVNEKKVSSILYYLFSSVLYSILVQIIINPFIRENVIFIEAYNLAIGEAYNIALDAKYIMFTIHQALVRASLVSIILFVVFKNKELKNQVLTYSLSTLILSWFLVTLLRSYYYFYFTTPFFLIINIIIGILGVLYIVILYFLSIKQMNTLKRLLFVSIIYPVVICLLFFVLEKIEVLRFESLLDLLVFLYVYIIPMTITNHFFALYKTVIRKEKQFIKKGLRSKAEYQQLKKQLSPHFLFNNINVLTSFIEESPKKAAIYCKKLSNIYQHFLEQEKHDLVSLKREMEFVQDYLDLLESRYEKSFSYCISIEGKHLEKKLVTTSLQQIIENVVKHNEISKQTPVRVRIISYEDYIVIINNVNLKLTKSYSGKGIKNIVERYSYFTKNKVMVENSETNFLIKLPLLKV